jgi:hypothetical protein
MLWVRSYSRWDRIEWAIGSRDDLYACRLESRLGRVRFGWYEAGGEPDLDGWSESLNEFNRDDYIWKVDSFWAWEALGFRVGTFGRSGGTNLHLHVFETPTWFPIMLFAVTPAIVARGFIARGLRSRHSAAQRCVRCGYDLRGTPATGSDSVSGMSSKDCPECGFRGPASSKEGETSHA